MTEQSPARRDVMDRLGFELARAGLAADARMQAVMSATGLKPRQCLALLHVAHAERMQQVALAEALAVDPSVLVAILNELELRELAIRRRDPQDRRRHVVELTERGSQVVVDTERAVAAAEEELFADLSRADRARLGDLLRRLTAARDPVECRED